MDEGAVLLRGATPGKRHRVRHKSYGMLGATVLSVFFTGYSLLARLFVCWGHDDDSLSAFFGCHDAHWTVMLLVFGMIVTWIFLVLELSDLHPESRRELGRRRAAWGAYRTQLDRHDKIVAAAATLFLIIGLFIIAAVLLSSYRF